MAVKAIAHSYWRSIKRGARTFESVLDHVKEDVRTLAEQRWQARQNRDWAEADRLRAEVTVLGWTIKDRKDGYDLARN